MMPAVANRLIIKSKGDDDRREEELGVMVGVASSWCSVGVCVGGSIGIVLVFVWCSMGVCTCVFFCFLVLLLLC